MSVRRQFSILPLVLAGVTVYGCSSDSGNGDRAPGEGQCIEGQSRDESGNCAAGPTGGTELGTGDGTPESVTFTEIYSARKKTTELVDLAFGHSDPTQLWVIGYGDDYVHLGTGVTADSVGTWKEYHDPAALHFMHKPTAIAMGGEPFWGICGDNGNEQNDRGRQPNYFMGPAMFTVDLAVFAKETEGGLGSHYDMLHNTSMCRGIAWEQKNVYWAFNGELGSLDKNNFNEDHGPGADDHSDGEIYRYAEGQVKGVDGVSSHLVFDASDNFLYVADTGNKRVVKLDTTVGELGGRLPRRNEPLKASAMMKGTNVEEVVPAGTLEQPSGIEVKGDLIYVSDTATSTFYVFDKTGAQIRKLETGLAPGSLSGFTFGPDGKIWFTDRKGGKVVRIDPPAAVN